MSVFDELATFSVSCKSTGAEVDDASEIRQPEVKRHLLVTVHRSAYSCLHDCVRYCFCRCRCCCCDDRFDYVVGVVVFVPYSAQQLVDRRESYCSLNSRTCFVDFDEDVVGEGQKPRHVCKS